MSKNAAAMMRGLPKRVKLGAVNKVLLVASGKGGVGKSTVAVNVALALSQLKTTKSSGGALASGVARSLNVGILDADIYGPSVPRMLNLSGRPEVNEIGKMKPLRNYGVPAISIGFLVDDSQPVVWRGLIVMRAIKQLLFDTDWSLDNTCKLDVLVCDLPPGTGDVALSIAQEVEVDGCLIVTTPQRVALGAVAKGAEMMRKLKIPIVGLVSNFASYECTACNTRNALFPDDGGLQKLAETLNAPLVGNIPVNSMIAVNSDDGRPVVVAKPDSSVAAEFRKVAQAVAEKLQLV